MLDGVARYPSEVRATLRLERGLGSCMVLNLLLEMNLSDKTLVLYMRTRFIS